MKTPTCQSMGLGAMPPLRSLRASSPKLNLKFATFSSKLHSYFRTLPRIGRGFTLPQLFTIQHQKFNIQNLGAPDLIPSSIKPFIPFRTMAAFTLIELMAATTVLSVILLLMVGMQDQMSKAWSNSNRRTDATREARAAARLMGSDLGGMGFRPNTPNSSYDSFATVLGSQGLPYLYSSNGVDDGSFTIPNAQSGSAYLFALCNQASRGTNYTDIGLVGYYIASRLTTNVSGFPTTNYNLHRYYVPASNAVSNLTSWFTKRTAASLFSGVDPTKDDILARNTCNLRITFFGKPLVNGLNYSNVANPSSTYRGNKVQIEWTTYPDDVAQKFALTDWANSTNIQKFGRSFEFRSDLRRN
jgi:type II secretory pathway pseudopilin PulG